MILKRILVLTLFVPLLAVAAVASGVPGNESGGGEEANALNLAIGGGIFYVNQSSWADVYNKANPVFGAKIGYRFLDKFEIFAECDYMKASGEMVPFLDECTTTMIPIYVGGRYVFKIGNLFRPYVGLAGVYGTLTEKGDFGEISASAFGPGIQVGTYIAFGKQIGLDVVIRYDRLIFKNDEYDTESDMSGIRLLLLLTYTFK